MPRMRIKKKYIGVIVVLIALLPFSSNTEPGEGDSEGSSNKQQKLSCYFGRHRYNKEYEKESRTTSTAVTIKCGGEPVKMGTLVQRKGFEMELHGAFSKPDLALARGGATYMKDQSEEAKWNEEYICPNHINELLTHWKSGSYRHINRGTAREDILCSWPFVQHDVHIRGKYIHYIEREEARLYLLATGRHVHIGTPICNEHRREMSRMIDDYLEKSSDPDFNLQVCAADDDEQCSREENIAKFFFDFASLVGINRPQKEYSIYRPDTQRKKVDGVYTVQKWTIHFLAPGEEDELQASVSARCSGGHASEAEASIDGVMEIIGQEFHDPHYTKRQRDYVIFLVASRYPYRVVAKYIPDLSKSKFYRAELIAYSGNLHPPDIPRHVDRIDREGMNWLAWFLASPQVIDSLPFGTRDVKLSTGEILQIPNTIRLMGHTEIVRQFGQFMREHDMENHLMSDSTIHRCIRGIPADERHSSKCVDKAKAKAFYAYGDWLAILDRLLELALINKEKHSKLRRNIQEVQLYLRTDYPLHLKNSSYIADHCLLWALSDPEEPDFRSTLSHDHYHHQCPRCNHMMTTMREMEELMKEVVEKSTVAYNKELREKRYRIKSATDDILELKYHEVRSVFADRVRDEIKATLEEGVGLLTLDFAMKWEPMWFYEPQEDWFAKAGQSWHVSHLLTKIGDQFVSHTYFHLLHNKVQDSAVVVSILEHVLRESRKMGVHTFNIRSDNAGPYHSAATLGSVQYLAQITETTVLSWSFSAEQHGKSDCDRKTGEAKTKIRSYVNTGNDVLDVIDIAKAMDSGRLMRGTSFHLVTSKEPSKKPDHSKLPQISHYGHFEFTSDTIRVWKYKGIGPGRVVPNMDHFEVNLEVHAEGGHLADSSMVDRERYLVEQRIEAGFWFNDYKRKDDNLYGEEHEDRDDDVAAETPAGLSNPRDSLHHCWCGAGFIRYKSLMNHLEWGTHRIIPEKIDIIDYVRQAFKRNIESISNQSPLLPLKDVSDAVFDPSIPVPEEGFAMKKKRKGGRLPARPRKFLVEYYERMMRESQRPEPKEALRLMAADDSITPEIRPTYQQTKSLFSRLSKATPGNRARRYTHEEDGDEGEWELEWDEMEECKEDVARTFYEIFTKINWE